MGTIGAKANKASYRKNGENVISQANSLLYSFSIITLFLNLSQSPAKLSNNNISYYYVCVQCQCNRLFFMMPHLECKRNMSFHNSYENNNLQNTIKSTQTLWLA